MTRVAVTPIREPEEALLDLRRRLRDTRWPDQETVPDSWEQGMPLRYAQRMAAHWADEYDWRATESRINAHENVRIDVDGLGVHALHARSAVPGARPLLLLHGWPGSIVEFLDVIEPLTSPPPGQPAFHVICPSLPGYGFSDRPTKTGWTLEAMAAALVTVMAELGYARFMVHGSDWGSFIAAILGARHAASVSGIHLVMPMAGPPPEPVELSAQDGQRLQALSAFQQREGAYAAVMATKPQSLAYGLTDSPAGLLGWAGEKYWAWSDHDGDAEAVIPRDRILDLLTVIWLTNTAASGARLYWESYNASPFETVDVPTAITVFPADGCMPRAWCERRFTRLLTWTEAPRGGHFPALEQPEVLLGEIRALATHAALAEDALVLAE